MPLGSCFLIRLSIRSATLMYALATLGGNSVISSGGMYCGTCGCPRGCPRGCLRDCLRDVSCGCLRDVSCGCLRGCLRDASSGGMYGGGRGVSHDGAHDVSSGGLYGGGRGGSHDATHGGTCDVTSSGLYGGGCGVSHESRMMACMTRVVASHHRPFHHMERGNRGHMSLTGLVCSLLHDISQNVRE